MDEPLVEEVVEEEASFTGVQQAAIALALFGVLGVLLVVFGTNKKDDGRGQKKKNDNYRSGHVPPNRYETLTSRLKGKSSVRDVADALRRAFERNIGGGILLDTKQSGRAIAMEYMAPHGNDGIKVDWILAPNEDRGKRFLRDETTESVVLSKNLFEDFRKHLLSQSHSNGGLVDVGSGCATYTGHVCPPK